MGERDFRRSLAVLLIGVAIVSADAVRGNAQDDDAARLEAMRRQAVAGSAESQFLLGRYYLDGSQLDADRAVFWFQKAAQQGHLFAQFELGLMNEEGTGVPRDPGQAALWYQNAATHGHARAAFRLSYLYFAGDGVPQDSSLAAAWCRVAAEGGLPYAQHVLGGLIGSNEKPDDDWEAVLWLQRASDQRYAQATFELGRMYYRGQGVERSFEKAIELWEPLAEAGMPDAQASLAYVYQHGHGRDKDLDRAVRLYAEAAAQGQRDAIQNLAVIYASGRGTEQDFRKARELWEVLAEQGDDDAQFGLGLLYFNGRGVPADLETAYMWLYLSAESKNEFAIEACQELERRMLSGQLEHAKSLAAVWREEHGPPRPTAQEDKTPEYPWDSTTEK